MEIAADGVEDGIGLECGREFCSFAWVADCEWGSVEVEDEARMEIVGVFGGVRHPGYMVVGYRGGWYYVWMREGIGGD